MSIAYKSATPKVGNRPRRRPLLLAPERSPSRTLAKIFGLIALTSCAAALATGAAALALVMGLSAFGH